MSIYTNNILPDMLFIQLIGTKDFFNRGSTTYFLMSAMNFNKYFWCLPKTSVGISSSLCVNSSIDFAQARPWSLSKNFLTVDSTVLELQPTVLVRYLRKLSSLCLQQKGKIINYLQCISQFFFWHLTYLVQWKNSPCEKTFSAALVKACS